MTQKKHDRDYYSWLVDQIDVHSTKTYNGVISRLHETEFIWFIPHDENRIGDAFDLRSEFLHGTHGWNHEDVLNFPIMTGKGATVLEILISLSRKTAFVCGGEPYWWAWQLIGNIGLYKFPDPFTTRKRERVDEILERLIWRTYEPNGKGGFFPLNWPKTDQTKLEIWQQLNQYAMEIQE